MLIRISLRSWIMICWSLVKILNLCWSKFRWDFKSNLIEISSRFWLYIDQNFDEILSRNWSRSRRDLKSRFVEISSKSFIKNDRSLVKIVTRSSAKIDQNFAKILKLCWFHLKRVKIWFKQQLTNVKQMSHIFFRKNFEYYDHRIWHWILSI